jgi:flagella basal body P-ring formation protein FlgA
MMKAIALAFTAVLIGATPALANGMPNGMQGTASAGAQNAVQVVVPVRNIARGDIISADDLTTRTVANGNLFSGVASAVGQLAGKQARRYLRLGQPVRIGDVRAPILVTKGATVTMRFHVPGITLTAVGKAMSSGGRGELVTVLNPVSYRQITATVTGPGTVSVGGSMNTISANAAPEQLAERN